MSPSRVSVMACCLTVKLRGRTTTRDERRGRTLSPSARGAKPLTPHGPLQRLLDGIAHVANRTYQLPPPPPLPPRRPPPPSGDTRDSQPEPITVLERCDRAKHTANQTAC